MIKITPHDENDRDKVETLAQMLHHMQPKMERALMLYGPSLIKHLFATKQHELLWDAMDGKLDAEKVKP